MLEFLKAQNDNVGYSIGETPTYTITDIKEFNRNENIYYLPDLT